MKQIAEYPEIGSEKWLDLVVRASCKRPSTLTNMECRALRDAELDAEREQAASQGWERII